MNAIEVKNVYKSFKVYYDKGGTLKERILFRKRNRYDEHHVLKGVDISIKKGEVVGLIGENGCGKSTLLKLMTRIIYPDQGNISINGKVSSLLELGAGFHPDMSGRENIYTNASIFGLSKKEIDERIDNIIEFSELGEFIDNPVRTYSSGMYMRLAFSVAINVDAEILLVDEILAVGDAAFQAKCFNKMQEIKKTGVTIVIVSHDLGSIEKLCNRAVWIKKGKKVKDGAPQEVSYAYLDYVMNKKGEMHKQVANTSDKAEKVNQVIESVDENNNKRWGNQEISISRVEVCNETGNTTEVIKTQQPMTIKVYFTTKGNIGKFSCGIGIHTLDGINVYGTNTNRDQLEFISANSQGCISFFMEECTLLPGDYYIDVALEDEDTRPLDYYCEAQKISVYSNMNDIGIVRLKHKWLIDNIPLKKRN